MTNSPTFVFIRGGPTKCALHEEVNTNWMQCDPTKSGGPHFVHLVLKRYRSSRIGRHELCEFLESVSGTSLRKS